MSEVVSIPQLRFPEFSGEWRVDKFVDLCKFQQGVQVDVELQSTEPKNNFLRFLRIENYTQKSNDFRYIPKELSSNKSITENEIAIVRYGATAGYIGRGLKGILANNLFKLVLNKDTLDTDYLFHLLRSYKTFCFFQSEMSGGAMPALSFGIVGALKLPYSSISEQQKIAAFLTAVDTKIEQLSKKKELLGEYKKGLMQKIFSQAIRFKADDGSAFPDWEERKLGVYLAHKSNKNKDNEVDLVLSVSNKKGFITQNEQFDGYQVASKDLTNYKIVEKGEYAYNPSRINVGSIARLKNNTIGIVSPMYVIFKLKNLDSVFFDNLYQTHLFKHLIKVGCSGSVRDSLNFNDMADFVFSFPSLEEQTKIANFLSSIDNKIEQVGKQLDESKQFKKALLQQMFV
jgi:type I restriction enzyme S subunit